jgi:hypothetical protein
MIVFSLVRHTIVLSTLFLVVSHHPLDFLYLLHKMKQCKLLFI